MAKRDLYRRVCQQYGLELVIEGMRWKVVDPSDGETITPATFPPFVRGFMDGYAEAMQRAAGQGSAVKSERRGFG